MCEESGKIEKSKGKGKTMKIIEMGGVHHKQVWHPPPQARVAPTTTSIGVAPTT